MMRAMCSAHRIDDDLSLARPAQDRLRAPVRSRARPPIETIHLTTLGAKFHATPAASSGS